MADTNGYKTSVKTAYDKDDTLPAEWGSSFFGIYHQPTDLLPAHGTRQRDKTLREFLVASHNTLVASAIMQMVTRVQTTAWEVKGGKRLARYYQDLLQDADHGWGWDTFIAKLVTDFLTQDFGAIVEIVGYGKPDKQHSGVTGLGQLDPARCWATRSDEYPLIYEDLNGAWHKLHKSRVKRFIDNPSPIEQRFNLGLCALSRMISVSAVQILMSKYQTQRLNDLPPTGIITLSGINDTQWNQALDEYNVGNQADGNTVWRNLMRFVSIKNEPIDVSIIPFSELPEHFNFREYMELHVNLVALALQDDPQNIWPLSGQGLGTGTQSRILHAKGQAKMFGKLLTMIERFINTEVLPDDLEFRFKYRDVEQDKERADTAQVWVQIASGATVLTDEEKRRLLANNVEAFQDVLLDEAGELRLPDSDKLPETDVIADDTTTNVTESEPNAAPESQTPVANTPVVARGLGGRHDTDSDVYKDYTSTKTEFITNVSDLLKAGTDEDVTRRRFGIVFRAHLNRLGTQAYKDGLAAGGVDDDLSSADRANIARIYAEQAAYVSDLSKAMYSGDLTIANFESRADMWAQKSLSAFYQAGLLEANGNGMYQWVLGNTEHCADCLRLAGQKHRLKEWHNSGWMPQGSNLECGGFRCQCELKRASGRSRGSY